MKIGIIGSGNIGGTLAQLFAKAGHEVLIANSRGPQSLKDLTLYDLGDNSSSEEIAKLMPHARLVKAFNTMYYKTLASQGKQSKDGRLAMFLAGDDSQAKQIVAKLIEDIGFAPLGTGSLRDGGRKQQPNSPLYNQPMTADEAKAKLATA